VVNKEELAELLDVVRLPERRRDTLEERIAAIEARREIADLVLEFGGSLSGGVDSDGPRGDGIQRRAHAATRPGGIAPVSARDCGPAPACRSPRP
jgi:hypothetical protein